VACIWSAGNFRDAIACAAVVMPRGKREVEEDKEHGCGVRHSESCAQGYPGQIAHSGQHVDGVTVSTPKQ
jgi:hypothetical protein